MNKSELFKSAHKLTKEVIQSGDNYRVTFGACLKVVIADAKAPKSISEQILEVGGKLWESHGFKRIYMTCDQFNQVTGRDYNLNANNNKIFYDFDKNAIMRSYKNKRPNVEVQY